MCLLGDRLVVSCDDMLKWGDGSTCGELGWAASALVPLDPFSVCCVGRRLAVHDSRVQRPAAVLAALPAPGLSAASVGAGRQQLLVGLSRFLC